MKILGIICEYNPFHRGHGRQLQYLREHFPDAALVCLMSGNFVQRGEPAIFPKEVRTEAALRAGADLVVEMPVPVTLSSAEGFALGSVDILRRLGTEGLCFGAETGDAEALMDGARALESPEFSQKLRPYLEEGLSFPAARARAFSAMGKDPDLISRPNNLLGLEYCKAILRTGGTILPIVIPRPGDYHAEEADLENPSATALRRRLLEGRSISDFVPETVRECYENAPMHLLEFGEKALVSRLWTMSESEYEALPFGSEGLWRRLRKAAMEGASYGEILEAAKSKRYTRSRLNRMGMCAYLHLTETDLKTPAPYVRLLGCSAQGRKALREMPRDFLRQEGQRVKDPWQDREDLWQRLYGLFAARTEKPIYRRRTVIR